MRIRLFHVPFPLDECPGCQWSFLDAATLAGENGTLFTGLIRSWCRLMNVAEKARSSGEVVIEFERSYSLEGSG